MVRRHCRSVLPALLLALLIALAASPSAMAYIYWGHQAYKTGVGRATLDGTTVDQPFVPSVAGNYAWVGAVAADASYLYWGNNNPNSTTGFAAPVFARANSDGTGVNQAFTASIGQAITGATAAGGYLYWTFNNQDTSGVGRTPIIGGQQYQAMESTFGETNPQTCGVAVDDTYIYFANRQTFSIGRAEIANFGTLAQVVDGEFIQLPVGTQPCGVAVDAEHIWWGTYAVTGGGAGTAIGRAAKNGTGVSFGFWGGGNRVTGVAVDDGFVYWSNYGTGAAGTGSIGRGTKATGGEDPSFVGGLDSPWGIAVDPKGAAPAPPTPVPSQLPPPPNPLSVGVNSGPSGGGSPSVAVPCSIPSGCQGPRPDFSRVWVTKASFVPATWSTPLIVGKKAGAGAAAARSGGTVFNYILDRVAVAKIAIQHREPGRRVGRSCRKPSRDLARRPACARYRTVATLQRAAIKGTNSLPFSGRIKGKALKPGSYRAVFSATAAGATGAADKAIAFRILVP